MRASAPTVLLVCCFIACGPRPTPADAGQLDAGDGGAPDAGYCPVLEVADCKSTIPTYGQLSPLFNDRCVVCHDGVDAGGPWPLKTYQQLSDWEDSVRSEIVNCTMPPLDSQVSITVEERQAIFNWVRCGRPQ